MRRVSNFQKGMRVIPSCNLGSQSIGGLFSPQGGRKHVEDFSCRAMCHDHVRRIGSRDPYPQAHDGRLRRGPAGDCEMPLRHRLRCRQSNLREGGMVPLLCTCLREVRPKFRPPELWRPFSLSLFRAQKTRQLGEVRGDPPRLVSAEHLGGRAPGGRFSPQKPTCRYP